MVEKIFLNILITQLTTVSEMHDLRRAVLVVNLHQGIVGVFVPVFANIANVFANIANVYASTGFWTLVLSNIACIVGLTLNWLSAGNDDKGLLDLKLFYPALVLMGLAQAVQTVMLPTFLYRQIFHNGYDSIKSQRRTKFWWILVSSVAAILNQLESLIEFHFKELVPLVLLCVKGSFYTVFLLVLICNTHEMMMNGEVTMVPSATEIVKVVPVNLKPLGVCMCILSLVYACGSTLFLLEASALGGRNHLAAILLLDNLVRFTEFLVSESTSYLLKRLRNRKPYNLLKMELLRIGIGMWCCVLCCNLAVGVSTHRKYDAGGDKMSVYWLMPQFLLLGLMGGLAKDGFQSLYESQASPKSPYRHGSSIGELAKGSGALLSMLCIFVFSGKRFEWFQNNLDSSSLNKYYNFLAVLSAVNLLFFCMVAFSYIGEDDAPTEKKDKGKRQKTDTAPTETIRDRHEFMKTVSAIYEETATGSHSPKKTAVDIDEETAIGYHGPTETLTGSHGPKERLRRRPVPRKPFIDSQGSTKTVTASHEETATGRHAPAQSRIDRFIKWMRMDFLRRDDPTETLIDDPTETFIQSHGPAKTAIGSHEETETVIGTSEETATGSHAPPVQP